MRYISLGLVQKFELGQKLTFSHAMEQAFIVMQMPVMELSSWLSFEILQNPLLESNTHSTNEEDNNTHWNEQNELDFENSSFEVLNAFDETFIGSLYQDEYQPQKNEEACSTYSLFEHLIKQLHEILSDNSDLWIAEQIIGNLESSGLLLIPLEEIFSKVQISRSIEILYMIQRMDPPGLAALTRKESLLIQLELLGKENSLASQILSNCYDELLSRRFDLIAKKLKSTPEEVEKTILLEIGHLNFHPASKFRQSSPPAVVCDIFLSKVENSWIIELNESALPTFQTSSNYLKLLSSSHIKREDRQFIRKNLAHAKWLDRILSKRQRTLKAIGAFLIKKQEAFLSGEPVSLKPMTIQEMAKELDLHESTATRAVANKSISCPRGIIPLRSLFTRSITSNSGESISTQTVKQLLLDLIEKEDKTKPLSDEKLSMLIEKRKIPCARRTIAKYRQQLSIPTCSQRRLWK